MSGRRILLVQGHPDASQPHLLHDLAQSYANAALAAGHTLHALDLGRLEVPLLRSPRAWEDEPVPAALADAQAALQWCQHLMLVYPLWLGDMPAVLKAFLEQVMRPGVAFTRATPGSPARKGLAGRSARVVVGMGMPAMVYRWFYGAHSLRSLERNILGFVGFSPVRHTLVGGAGGLQPAAVAAWERRLARLGSQAA
ncbi:MULTISPECIES: NAD(P)H-dependent oxidoreductase [Ramlibacter]|uniref:NAD(P)H-dependent oxidoreductase n=1 Tax=Ramlibacter aquaticus TaxID=2780094 RepID=A0ABR9SBC9_9BURK|nr:MULTISPECIES: NAD(P)H-dependent oxidoreductase [Ramlibacter]MBE7939655.1 NAD(P)H-dependent oxidoreductase [Ramlibacter aquaticus]